MLPRRATDLSRGIRNLASRTRKPALTPAAAPQLAQQTKAPLTKPLEPAAKGMAKPAIPGNRKPILLKTTHGFRFFCAAG